VTARPPDSSTAASRLRRFWDRGRPVTPWRDLLFFRLYRSHAPLSDRFADAFEAADQGRGFLMTASESPTF
jgi:hypothetical protein